MSAVRDQMWRLWTLTCRADINIITRAESKQGKMCTHHVPDAGQVRGHHVVLEAGRRALEQDGEGVAQHGEGGHHHDHREHQRADRVRDLELGPETFDQDRGDEHADALQQVPEHVYGRGPDVDVLGVAPRPVAVPVPVPPAVAVPVSEAAHAVQDEAEQDVEDHGAARHHHHRGLVDLEVVVVDPPDGEVDEDARHVPDDAERGQGAQSLGPVVAEGHLLGRLPLAHVEHEQTDAEAGEVAEHVRGVGHDGEGAGHPAAHHLARHEDGAEERGEGELPPRHLARVPHRLQPVAVLLQLQVAAGVARAGAGRARGGEEERHVVTRVLGVTCNNKFDLHISTNE